MCGRYRLSASERYLRDHFGVEFADDWSPRYNIAPAQPVPVIRQDAAEPVRRVTRMRWGLVPFWAKDLSVGYKMINARAETVATSAAFRGPFKSQRCLIPADGFYEWKKTGGTKQPYCFVMGDGSPFAFAGLWDRWKNDEGNTVTSCSIITTTPNSLLADVHDRMPVILRPEDYDVWLDPGFKDTNTLRALLVPFEAALMQAYPVSTRVNSVKNDDPSCAQLLNAAAAASV